MSSAPAKAPDKPPTRWLWRNVFVMQDRTHAYKAISICVDDSGELFKVYTLITNGKMTELVLRLGESHTKDGKTRSFTEEEAEKYAPLLRGQGHYVKGRTND